MKIKTKNITAFIIAGGESSRFGQDKLLFKYKGIALIERVVNVLKNIFNDIMIISDRREDLSYLKLPIFPDIISNAGPLGGIYTALCQSETHKTFCFAGDLPNLSEDFIEYMISISDGHDIVTPYFGGFYETLHTIYTKNCTQFVKNDITSGVRQVIKFYDKCDLRKVELSEIKMFTDPKIIFKNINSIEDIEL